MSARAKGVTLLLVGIVLLLISRPLLGANDVNGLLGGLCIGIGGASVVSSLASCSAKNRKCSKTRGRWVYC